jgi:ABC-type bacteriocin/lantibiotic exporter with double-glycine peptidase domain
MCGAAALCMVYRSFGLACTQNDLWPAIKTEYADRLRRGSQSSALVRHALHEGYAAVCLRAARPWQLLSQCLSPHLRVIVLHRRGFDSHGLHASVLCGLDENSVILQDPNARPNRRLLRDDFLALWGPHPRAVFDRGYLLVLIGPLDRPDAIIVRCPHCRQAISLQPTSPDGPDWAELTCPYCETCLTELPDR